MWIRSARFFAFRNLAEVRIELEDGFNVLAGRNGQGKTNVLEGLYLLGMPRGFRSGRYADWVMNGASRASVRCLVDDGRGERSLALELEEGRRSFLLDERRVPGITELAGHLKIVFFGPEDLRLVKGGPEERRRLLDRGLFREDPSHLARVQELQEVLRHRSALLRDFGTGRLPGGLLESYEERFLDMATRLTCARASFAAALEGALQRYWEGVRPVCGGGVSLRYRSGFDLEISPEEEPDTLRPRAAEALERARRDDLVRHTTGVGPHLDDLELLLDGRPARFQASQGQVRSLAAALRMGELLLWKERRGSSPVLMMDDLSSELDREHYRVIMEGVRAHAGQVILTTTSPEYVLQDIPATLYHVCEGRVERHAGTAS
ncbi:MAG: DNA replication and repair protein RecF [Deltaproteobacteria bacterium]|nr:DNA replication and repair protein RecF [Deltaproteobacteria bacterium]